jgi:O-antigen biosynthesis protein
MRVALLSHSAQSGDAIGRQLAEKVAFFLDRGADARLFVETDRRLHAGLRPYTFRYAPPKPRGPHWRFLTSVDLVIVEYGQHYGLLDLLPLLAGGKPRVLFDYHGVTPPDLGGANHRDALERGRRLRGLVWYADAAAVHSHFARGELLDDTRFPPGVTYQLGYPVDSSWFTPGPAAATLRERLGLAADTKLVLFVGRVAPNKRVPLLVDAVARLRDATPAAHAVIVGDSGDCYEAERQRCRERAARLGASDRIHFVGRADEAGLRDAYRSADVFVMPSVHEGFCIPVIEAMACGLPVVAARAAALPETVADAGLTFSADDAADLARQIARVLDSQPASPVGKGDGGEGFAAGEDPPPSPRTPLPTGEAGDSAAAPCLKVAVVTPRYGSGFVGGAETSLRTLAESLYQAGHDVTVFTTCAGNGRVADNHLPERSAAIERYAVHRYFTDPADRDRYARAAAALTGDGMTFDPDEEYALLQNSLRSARLVDALRRDGPFDAIFVGPYLLGLTYDVARAFPDRTILVPCFHDEPTARLPALREGYESVAGVLYHSPEERHFAEATLGLNLPNVHVLGTLIDADTPGDAGRGRALVGTERRYLLYCGRYHRDKGVSELLDFAARYAAAHPGRFTFAFAGMGEVTIPNERWARDLGYVSDAARRDLMAGADALVLLSPNESLSLAVLEAQAQGTPVIVRAGTAILEGHVIRGGGGRAVGDYEAFAATLDDLWDRPQAWRDMGTRGREYVRCEFSDPSAYATRWQAALSGMDVPLAEKLRANGFARAKAFDRPAWREQFAQVIERLLDAPARPRLDALEISPRLNTIEMAAGSGQTGIPVRLTNRGQHPEVADGPGRAELVSRTVDADGRPCGPEQTTPLPGLLLPSRDVAAVVRVGVPPSPGRYVVELTVRRAARQEPDAAGVPIRVEMSVTDSARPATVSPPGPNNLMPALLAAQAAQRLPDGYTDVSEGRFGRLKLWLKRKLLHNFQHAYVNVLSRQQSVFNAQVLAALAELADIQAGLAHSARLTAGSADADALRAEVRDLRRRCARLARQLGGSTDVRLARPAKSPRRPENAA